MKPNQTYDAFSTDLNRFLIAIVEWQKQGRLAKAEGDRDAAKRYAQDVDDLSDIYNVLRRGDFQSAFHMALELDTLVRDQIPRRLYNFIAKAAGCR